MPKPYMPKPVPLEVGNMFEFRINRGGSISKSCIIPKMTDQGYFYINIPAGSHGRTERVWINRKAIVQKRGENDKETYQIHDWLDYRVTNKGNIVLMPSDNKNETIVLIFAECGYRGDSKIEIENGEVIKRGLYYHSPRGSLGISDVVLAKVRDGTKIVAKRTGRLYGAPSTVTAKIVFTHQGIDLIEAQEESDEELAQLL